jgi:protein-tyrosine kinase
MEHIEKALAKAREARSQFQGAARPESGKAFRQSDNGLAPDYSETLVTEDDRRRGHTWRLVADDHGHPISDVYRLLRAQLLQRMKKFGISALAVTSARSGDGATTSAANLAISIALDVNQTVLLVDLNLRDPSIYRKFGLNPTYGIDNYLRGECELKQCLINPGLQRLVVLPAHTPKGGEIAEMISSPRMAALTKELRNRYADRIILFDTPPLLESGETLGFLPNVEGVLFVARSGRTKRAELDRAADLLKHFRVIGTVLNAG